MLHSISDLTTLTKPTTGHVPAKLVGASTTVVGSKMYLFGGRLVSERRMTNDLYAFDLETLNWERVAYSVQDPSDVPRPRYFHSSDSWNNHLIIFGGMSNKTDANNPEDLCVLNDIRLLDLSTNTWLPTGKTNPFAFPTFVDPPPESLLPRARYAHLSSVTADRLFIIGGQDIHNVWLDDACVYDLKAKQWIRRSDYPRHCGTYRSVAVSSDVCVRIPQDSSSRLPANWEPGTRFRLDESQPPKQNTTHPDSIVHLPYSAPPTLDAPCDIYLYSNYNFTDVKRELEVFTPLPATTEFSISDRSHLMPGPHFPPGLRFPTGSILGNHFIVAGTYLAQSYQSFSIWALDLVTMIWTRIDPGNALATGSWFRSCLWASSNKFYVFGNRNGNLVDDYNRRLLSWEDVAVVDLEAFGIYQPPKLLMGLDMQEAGLAALEEGVNADFDFICDDGRKIKCSRKILEARWPWFKEQRLKFLQAALTSMETLTTPASLESPLPDAPGVITDEEARPDPRLTPRALNLSEPYAITMAFLQYIYSTGLLTPLQHAPAVLSQLLVLATTYKMGHLESLVKHAMHGALSNTTSVGVYEVATLCDCRSLQIRALKTVMAYSQKRPSRKDRDTTNGGDRPPDGGHSSRPNGSGPPSTPQFEGPSSSSRPRGTSDAYWRSGGYGGGGSSSSGPAPVRQYAPELRSPEVGTANGFEHVEEEPYDGMIEQDEVDAYMTSRFASKLAPPAGEPCLERRARLDHRASVSTIAHQELCEVADLLMGEAPVEEVERQGPYLSPPLLLSPNMSRAASVSTDSSDNDQASVASSDRSLFFSPPPPRKRPSRVAPIITRRPSDSDTPSLTSSTASLNSSRNGHRRSPITPLSANHSPYMDHATSILPHLGSIEERQLTESMDTLTIRAVDSDMVKSSSDFTTLLVPGAMSPPIKWVAPSVHSSNSSGTHHSGGFSLFKKSTKSSDRDAAFASKEDAKAAKAEEKKRKKAEARERTEKLALELKRRQEQRAESASQHSGDSKEKKKKVDPASMYGSTFHMLGV